MVTHRAFSNASDIRPFFVFHRESNNDLLNESSMT